MNPSMRMLHIFSLDANLVISSGGCSNWNGILILPLLDMLEGNEHIELNRCPKEALILGCWSIWNHRNHIIFDAANKSIDVAFHSFKDFLSPVRHRAKTSLREGMSAWLDTL